MILQYVQIGLLTFLLFDWVIRIGYPMFRTWCDRATRNASDILFALLLISIIMFAGVGVFVFAQVILKR